MARCPPALRWAVLVCAAVSVLYVYRVWWAAGVDSDDHHARAASECSRTNAKFWSEAPEVGVRFAPALWPGGNANLVALASYPRSGNSLLRTLLERLTGVWTGSIYQDYRLKESGWKGEGFYRLEDGVVFVKTHDPMFPRYAKEDFQPERAVYLVRNPFNAIRSYFHLEVGGSHNQSLTDAELQERADKWAYYVDRQPAVWVDHVDHWIRWSSLKPDRLLLLRYEDLAKNPTAELEKIVNWWMRGLSVASDDASALQLKNWLLDRIPCAANKTAADSHEGYRPRPRHPNDTTGAYSEQQVRHVIDITSKWLCHFGYAQDVEHTYNVNPCIKQT